MAKAPPDNDPVRQRIVSALALKGLNYAEVSRLLGRNPTYIQQFITKRSPVELPEDVRHALATMLGIPETELKGPNRPRASRSQEAPNAILGPSVDFGDTGRLPVYGQAVGGRDGRFVFNGTKVDDVLTPPLLRGVPNAYAVYVAGSSMEPRYRAGETVYVHPHLPPRKGDFVVVQIHNQEGEPPAGFIKEFVSRDYRRLRLSQFNPKKMLEFPDNVIVSVHKIVLAG